MISPYSLIKQNLIFPLPCVWPLHTKETQHRLGYSCSVVSISTTAWWFLRCTTANSLLQMVSISRTIVIRVYLATSFDGANLLRDYKGTRYRLPFTANSASNKIGHDGSGCFACSNKDRYDLVYCKEKDWKGYPNNCWKMRGACPEPIRLSNLCSNKYPIQMDCGLWGDLCFDELSLPLLPLSLLPSSYYSYLWYYLLSAVFSITRECYYCCSLRLDKHMYWPGSTAQN